MYGPFNSTDVATALREHDAFRFRIILIAFATIFVFFCSLIGIFLVSLIMLPTPGNVPNDVEIGSLAPLRPSYSRPLPRVSSVPFPCPHFGIPARSVHDFEGTGPRPGACRTFWRCLSGYYRVGNRPDLATEPPKVSADVTGRESLDPSALGTSRDRLDRIRN